MLEQYLRQRKQERGVLLMTHIVLGYRDFDESLRLVETMVEAGVDLMELQIPFSEPIADGPVILRANQQALAAGSTVDRCLELGEQVASRFDIPFLFMTYYNVLFRRGVAAFTERMRAAGMKGAIVPDLPPEEGSDYLRAMEERALCPIFIYSPNTDDARLAHIAEHARGFVYCVARKGVTGSATDFSAELDDYLARCRAATDLPLAVGFGVKEAADVAFLAERADIAVVGTQSIRVMEERGVPTVGTFLRSLRP